MLRWRELIVEDDNVRAEASAEFGDFTCLAASDECAGIGSIKPLSGDRNRFCASGPGKSLEFSKRLFERPVASRSVYSNENGLFSLLFRFDKRKSVLVDGYGISPFKTCFEVGVFMAVSG